MPAWVHLRDSQVGQQQPSLTSITIGSYRPATAPVNARYTLLPPRSEARYHQGIKPKLEAWLGTDTVGQVAMELVLQRHCATTASSYGTGVRSFLSFCAEYSIDPAAVDSSHIQRYIAWMGLRGTVKAASLRNYLSAVNSFLRDNDREPIAQGKMVSDSLRALAARQEDTIVSAHRAPLAPACFCGPQDLQPRGAAHPQQQTLQYEFAAGMLCYNFFLFLFQQVWDHQRHLEQGCR